MEQVSYNFKMMSLFSRTTLLLVLWMIAIHSAVAENTGNFSTDSFIDRRSKDDQGKIIVQGAGAAFPNELYQEVIFAYGFEHSGVHVSYKSQRSSKGKCRIKDYLAHCGNPYNVSNTRNETSDNEHPFFVDFAGSDSLLSDSDYEQYPDLQMYPAVAGALVPVYNLPLGNKTLILSPEILAKIFRKCNSGLIPTCESGSISMWNDTLILEQNPDPDVQAVLNDAGNITVVVREDNSGQSETWKKALSTFETAFANQIGTSSSNEGYAAIVEKHDSNGGLLAFVSVTEGSIGYSVLGNTLRLGLPHAKINKGTPGAPIIIDATVETVTNAVLEKGLQFGLNGEPRERLTADIDHALGSEAWPISSYTYFVLRKNTLRPGATCENRLATLQFLEFFYEESIVEEIEHSLGFAGLPEKVKNVVLSRLRQDLLCEGTQVYVPPPDNIIRPKVWVPSFLGNVFEGYKRVFEHYESLIVITSSDSEMNPDIMARIDEGKGIGFTLGMEHLQMVTSRDTLLNFPYASVGLGAVFNFCGTHKHDSCEFLEIQEEGIILDIETLSKILDKSITMWDNCAIANLQREGVVLPHQPIVVIGQEEDEARKEFERILTSTRPSFNGSNTDFNVGSLEELRAAVKSTRFSIGFTPVVDIEGKIDGQFLSFINVLRPNSDTAVKPTALTIENCGTDTYVMNGRLSHFDLEKSIRDDCYPIVTSLNVVTKSKFNGEACTLGDASTTFIGFLNQHVLFEDGVLSAGTALENTGLGPLMSISTAVSEQSKINLFGITCNGVSILQPPEEKNLIESHFVHFTYFILAVHLVLVAYFSRVVKNRKGEAIIKTSSPFFLQQALLGSVIGMGTIIPLSMQDNKGYQEAVDLERQQRVLDGACQSIPFLYTIGFVIVYSALWLKTWRLHKIFNNRKLKYVNLTNPVLRRYLFASLSVVVFVNTAWVLTDPLHYERFEIDPEHSSDSGIKESYAYCTSNNWHVFVIPLSLIMLGAIVYGFVLLYSVWKLPKIFNESKWISFALTAALEALIVGVPILFISGDSPTARFLVIFFIIVATMLVPVLFMFLPKILDLTGSLTRTSDDDHNSGKRSDGKTGSYTFSQNATALLSRQSHGSHGSNSSLSNSRTSNNVDQSFFGKSNIVRSFDNMKITSQNRSKKTLSAVQLESQNKKYRSYHDASMESQLTSAKSSSDENV